MIRSVLRRFGWHVGRMPVPVRVTNAWESLKRLDIRTVIDVGAYDGDTGRIFRDMWPNAELHCFEPQVEIFSRLRNWASTQNGQVHAYNFAVGNVSRIQTLRVVQERDRTASIIRRFDDEQPGKMPVASHEVRVERLDDVLDAAALTAGIFIKIDVEGFEREVMRGGSAVLDRAAVCVIEHHTRLTPHGAADMAEIAGILESHGLTFTGMVQQVFGKNGRYVYGDALFTNWPRCALRTDTQSASTHQG